jgi:carbon-monoxide dehydrogenase medium subunit
MTASSSTRHGWEAGKVYRSVLPEFEYHSATTIQEAIKLKSRYGRNARFLAGGTDIVVRMKMDRAQPMALIDVKRVKTLGGPIKMSGKNTIAIPPLTTLADVARSPLLKKKLPVLPYTALLMASPQVRNRATVGGNLANAAPSADMAPPLIALGATVKLHTRTKIRSIPIEDLFTGPGETVLGATGVLGVISVPLMQRTSRAAYHAHTVREAMDLSIASAAVRVDRKGRTVTGARIVLGAVAPVPLLVVEAALALVGTKGEPAVIEQVARICAEACHPITDVRASDAYRREIVRIVVTRALREVLR